MIIYDNMIYFMMANDISRERNNIFRSNEMISRERNNIKKNSTDVPLGQGFSTWGTRTPGGTWDLFRGYENIIAEFASFCWKR